MNVIHRAATGAKIGRRRRRGGAIPDDLHTSFEERFLADSPHLREENLPRIADDLLFSERHRPYPPAMAGTMVTRSASTRGVSSSLRKRMSSSLRKMFTYRRTAPASSKRRGPIPGKF